MEAPQNIIISRTDSIGDVVLTLPVAAVLKKYFPQTTIAFMAKKYTQPVIEACKYVDEFIDVEAFLHHRITIHNQSPEVIIHVLPVAALALRAQELNIAVRIGTRNRIYHWTTCNKLVKLSRKNSSLHEAQLNLKLLEPLSINTEFSLDEIENLFGLERIEPLQKSFQALIRQDAYNLVLHPKSQGSGREWPLDHFIQLIHSLDPNRYNIFISGTEKERASLAPLFAAAGSRVKDITGQMTLPQFISFINHCDGLVASGTGPLHIAAALGKDALGIYPPVNPIHPGRWRPLGPKAKVFVMPDACNDCKHKNAACHCISEVEPFWLKKYLDKIAIPFQQVPG